MSATVFLIRRVLDEIRPMLAHDGGDVELLSYSSGVAQVRYEEGVNDVCSECLMPAAEFRSYLTDLLRERVKETVEVEIANSPTTRRASSASTRN